jgi:hypothetical protein
MIFRRGTRNHSHPALPGVNLLSASAFSRLATRRLRLRFLVAGAALVALVVASGTLQHLRVVEAERTLAVEQVETTRLGADNQALAPVRSFVSGVALQKQTVESNMAGEIYTSEVLAALRGAALPGLRLESLSLVVAASGPATAMADAAGATPLMTPCPGPDPFNTRTVTGCVTLTGTAGSRAEVGELVIALGNIDLFVEPFISTTTTADLTGVSFSGSVGLSRAAFSRRYGVPDASVAAVVLP